MEIILGIFMMLGGIVMIFFPQVIYEMREWWRSDAESDPSDAMLWLIRISGVFCVAIAIGCFIYRFI
ncbi:MAG: hypothetical protein J6Q76_04390 [Clostridia bacterium]|nr:hypothetical protein [Clostridia bacterium]